MITMNEYILLKTKQWASLGKWWWSLLWLGCHLKLNIVKKTQKLKWLKIFTGGGSWVHGHGTVGLGVVCRGWGLPPSWFWNDWSEVAEVMAV